MTSAASVLEPPADTRADAEHMVEQFKTLAGLISGSRLASAAGVRVALARAVGAIETWRDHLIKMIDVTVPGLQERYQRVQAQYEAELADLQAHAASTVAAAQPMGALDGLQVRNHEMAAARDQALAEILEDYHREMGLLDQTAADAASEIDISIGTVVQDPVAAGTIGSVTASLSAAFGFAAGAGKSSPNVMPDRCEIFRGYRPCHLPLRLGLAVLLCSSGGQ